MADKEITVPVTTSLQAAWDAKPTDWKEQDAVVLDLKDGDNGSLRIDDDAMQAKRVDVVLRVSAGITAQLTTAVSAPISVDKATGNVRLIIDARSGNIVTDCEREIVSEDDPHGIVYSGAEKTALALDGVDECVIYGHGHGQDLHGNPSVRVMWLGAAKQLRKNGDALRRWIDERTILVLTRHMPDLRTFVFVPPKGF